MIPSASTKAIIYCRVSDSKQKTEGHGLQSQETRCREYAGHKGYEVVAAFHDDITGKATKRPAMLAMLAMLKKNRKDPHVVIIDDISRLARSVRAHMDLRAAIEVSGGILESPSIEFGDDADSEMREYILATVAQHHRRKNAEQVKNRMRARTMGGYWCFQAPVGYRYAKVDGHGKLLVRDEPYATLIREALEGYASGRFQTQAEVQRFLLAQPDWQGSTNRTLSPQHVTDLLKRTLYAGYIDIPDWGISLQPGRHEALIDFDTYQTIQSRMKGLAKVPARKNLGEDFVLKGFLNCHCGKPFQGCWSKGRSRSYAYYLCANKECLDYGKSVARDKVEGEFVTLLEGMRPAHPLFAMARDMFRDIWDARTGRVKEQRREIDLELKRIDHGIAQLVDRVVDTDSLALITAYENRIRAFEERKVELRENIARSGKPLREFTASFRTAMQFLGNPSKLWLSDNIAYRRIVLKLAFADRLTYARNGGFRTAARALPFALLERLGEGNEAMVGPAGLEPAT